MTSTRAVHLLLASTLSVSALCFSSAHAEESSLPKPCVLIPDCAEQLKKAQQLTKDQRDDEALKAFLVLYAQFPDPRLCVGIGRMLHRRGQYEKAAIFYQRLLDSGVENDPQNLAKVRRFLAEAKAGMQAEANAAAPAHPQQTLSPGDSSATSAPSKPTAASASAIPGSPVSVALTPSAVPRPPEQRPSQAIPSTSPSEFASEVPTASPRSLGLRPMPNAPFATGHQPEAPLNQSPIPAAATVTPMPSPALGGLKPFETGSGVSTRTQDRVPVYKRWWFWTAMGTVTAGVVIGAALGAYAREPDWPGVETIHPFP